MIAEVIASILVIGGAFFMFTAALGIVRMPDIYTRLHCSTKSATLGVGLILLAVAVNSGEGAVWARAIAGIAFFMLTVPVAGHILARAGYRVGAKQCAETLSDEWANEGGPSTTPVREETRRYEAIDPRRAPAD
ncbi:MAG: monovalent cation/H(+) antiporter subunit G [Planctomycetota bacterium]|nr:MAG: monovalent cation/H(+) antiporter subunit G [Planctomycetota bacterium]